MLKIVLAVLFLACTIEANNRYKHHGGHSRHQGRNGYYHHGGHGGHRGGSSGFGSSGFGSSGSGSSGSGSSGFVWPGTVVPGSVVPGSVVPGSVVPGSVVPSGWTYGAAAAAPSFGVPSFGLPSFGVPSFGVPEVVLPSYGVPSYGVPALPSYGLPSYGVQALPAVQSFGGLPAYTSASILEVPTSYGWFPEVVSNVVTPVQTQPIVYVQGQTTGNTNGDKSQNGDKTQNYPSLSSDVIVQNINQNANEGFAGGLGYSAPPSYSSGGYSDRSSYSDRY